MTQPLPKIQRLPDWQLRLEHFLQARMLQKFEYGSNDCGLFAADAVWAMTGVDFAPHLRSHTSAREAIATQRRHAGLGKIAARLLGPAGPVQLASVGDVLLLKIGKREALGICNGTAIIGPGPAGLAYAPMAAALACWRVV